jgi:hypothetical protein
MLAVTNFPVAIETMPMRLASHQTQGVLYNWHGANLHVGRPTRSSEKMHTLPKHARNDFVTGVFYDK